VEAQIGRISPVFLRRSKSCTFCGEEVTAGLRCCMCGISGAIEWWAWWISVCAGGGFARCDPIAGCIDSEEGLLPGPLFLEAIFVLARCFCWAFAPHVVWSPSAR